MMSATKDETILPNAAPMMMPTAMSTTFPRMANSRNSVMNLPMNLFSLRAPAGGIPALPVFIASGRAPTNPAPGTGRL